MTAILGPQWLDGQPATVRAVITLADTRRDLGDQGHDAILAMFLPKHADVIVQLAADLADADRLLGGNATDALVAYWAAREVPGVVAGSDVAGECERLAEQHRLDALRAAQLVASAVERASLAEAR